MGRLFRLWRSMVTNSEAITRRHRSAHFLEQAFFEKMFRKMREKLFFEKMRALLPTPQVLLRR